MGKLTWNKIKLLLFFPSYAKISNDKTSIKDESIKKKTKTTYKGKKRYYVDFILLKQLFKIVQIKIA